MWRYGGCPELVVWGDCLQMRIRDVAYLPNTMRLYIMKPGVSCGTLFNCALELCSLQSLLHVKPCQLMTTGMGREAHGKLV